MVNIYNVVKRRDPSEVSLFTGRRSPALTQRYTPDVGLQFIVLGIGFRRAPILTSWETLQRDEQKRVQ